MKQGHKNEQRRKTSWEFVEVYSSKALTSLDFVSVFVFQGNFKARVKEKKARKRGFVVNEGLICSLCYALATAEGGIPWRGKWVTTNE